MWLERLPQPPLRGVMIANEVADALPCRRFTWRDGAISELQVALGVCGAALLARAWIADSPTLCKW